MFISFKIHNYINKQLDYSVCNKLDNQFPQYSITYHDEKRIVFKKRLFFSTNYGNNMRHTMNLINTFLIKKKDNELHLYININHLIFTLMISLIGLVSFIIIFNSDIYPLSMLVFIVYSLILYRNYCRIKDIIKIISKVID